MSKINPTDLDNWITGHYGEDFFMNDERDDLTDTLEDIGGTHLDTPPAERIAEMQGAKAVGWMDQPTEVVTDVLERRTANRKNLLDWVKVNLVEGSDYGIIKGRKSLWKAGAEKIAGMLGLQVNWPDLHQELDRLRAGADTIFLSCELLRDGQVQAQGAGARNVDDDKGDWNKAIKMAKKSAMIDAVLNVAGLSEVFTQDLEDMDRDSNPLSTESVHALEDVADKLFPENWTDVLESLARRRFHIADGDYTKIPAYRLNDAIRSLQEKAERPEGHPAEVSADIQGLIDKKEKERTTKGRDA